MIGTVLIPGAKAPKLLSRALVAQHAAGLGVRRRVDRPGRLRRDLAADVAPRSDLRRGGRRALLRRPTCRASCPHTSTYALTNATLSYALALADRGFARRRRARTRRCAAASTSRTARSWHPGRRAAGVRRSPRALTLDVEPARAVGTGRRSRRRRPPHRGQCFALRRTSSSAAGRRARVQAADDSVAPSSASSPARTQVPPAARSRAGSRGSRRAPAAARRTRPARPTSPSETRTSSTAKITCAGPLGGELGADALVEHRHVAAQTRRRPAASLPTRVRLARPSARAPRRRADATPRRPSRSSASCQSP